MIEPFLAWLPEPFFGAKKIIIFRKSQLTKLHMKLQSSAKIGRIKMDKSDTPPKTNMEPENDGL